MTNCRGSNRNFIPIQLAGLARQESSAARHSGTSAGHGNSLSYNDLDQIFPAKMKTTRLKKLIKGVLKETAISTRANTTTYRAAWLAV
jgi:hypothetical protein